MFQTKLIRCAAVASAAFLAAVLLAQSTQAGFVQVPLSPSNVIGGSGAYSGPSTISDFNVGQFNATQILDNQTGVVTELSQSGYWINGNNTTGPVFITVDLGFAAHVTQLELFNTANSNYQDRGTGAFQILGGNAVTAVAGEGMVLSGPTTVLLSSTLAPATAAQAFDTTNGIPGQFFTVPGATAFRYLEFLPTSVAAGGNSCCGTTNYGLNELRVFTPEPGSLVLLGLGAAGVVAVARRRRRA